MSTNVAYAGFSLKLDENKQTEESLKEMSKLFGFAWNDDDEWEDILYNEKKYMNRWKPMRDFNGICGFVWVTHYEYDASDLEYKQSMSAMENSLDNFIETTDIIPQEDICAFAQIYYNGSDDPFTF